MKKEIHKELRHLDAQMNRLRRAHAWAERQYDRAVIAARREVLKQSRLIAREQLKIHRRRAILEGRLG